MLSRIRTRSSFATDRPTPVRSQSGERLSGAEAAKRDTEFVATHLVEWDIRDTAGESVPITAVNCGRLLPRLFNRLLDIVAGYDIGDLKHTN